MDFYNIYGNKPGGEIKPLFLNLAGSGLKTALKTAEENGYEIETIIKIGNHTNWWVDEIVYEKQI